MVVLASSGRVALALALGLVCTVALPGCRPRVEGTPSPTAPAASGPATSPSPSPPSPADAAHVEITILSTMLAERGIGEWGFAALVEAGGRRILFDTGARRDTVLRNAKTLGIDLGTVDAVVLSHHHDDHVGGLLALNDAFPEALHEVHVARGMFEPRRGRDPDRELNDMLAIRPAIEASKGRFVVHDGPAEIAPGVWVTGPVPRVHDERNWGGGRRVPDPGGGWTQDTIPESQSLVIVTEQGLVVLSGCGHAGIVNTIVHARASIADVPVHAAIGGFHLLGADDDHLEWTATQLESVGLAHFFGAHCTGLEPVYRFRERLALRRDSASVAAVGARFVLGEGIHPLSLAR